MNTTLDLQPDATARLGATRQAAAAERRAIDVPMIGRTAKQQHHQSVGLVALRAVASAGKTRGGARQPLDELNSAARSAGAPRQDVDSIREQLLSAKREAQLLKEENAALKVAAARSEREARAAEKERDDLLRSHALHSAGDARLSHRLAEGALVGRLRAHAKQLAADLAAREKELAEVRAGAKHARAVELDVERRAYLQETHRLRQLLDAGATDLEAHKAVWQQEYEAELRSRLADTRRLEQRLAEMKQRERALDEELGRWMGENDKLRAALAEAAEKAKGGSRAEAERALAKELARERERAVAAEEERRSAGAALLSRTAQLQAELEKVQGKCRALSERCGRLEREKRDALRELALEQAAGLQAQREAEAREVELARLGGSSLAGQHAAASLPELVAQHNAAAAKMQAAARRRFSQGAEERPAAVSAQLAKQPAAGADAAQATPGQAGAGVAQQPSQGQARAEGSASTQSGMPARNQAAQPSDSTLAPKGGGATTVSSDEEMGPAPSAKPVPSPQKGGGFMSGLFGSTPP